MIINRVRALEQQAEEIEEDILELRELSNDARAEYLTMREEFAELKAAVLGQRSKYGLTKHAATATIGVILGAVAENWDLITKIFGK